jgi:hypothetical protein
LFRGEESYLTDFEISGPNPIEINIENMYGNIYIFVGPQNIRYSVTVTQISSTKGKDMAPKALPTPKAGGNGIPIGGTGTFVGSLLANGTPINLPSGATWQWSSDDPSASIQPDPSDPSGGTVDVSIPAGDTNTQITITAATTAPDGSAQTGSLTVPLTSTPMVFSVVVAQTA